MPHPTSPISRPSPNSYWLPGGRILCGEYPFAADAAAGRLKLDALIRAGVHTFIDLTTSADGLRSYADHALVSLQEHKYGYQDQIEILKFPIEDVSVPPDSRMTQILDAIDNAVNANRIVYLHCWGGVGRTGTVAGCWLRRHGASADDALRTLGERWRTVEKSRRKPHCPETQEQRDYIRNWNERHWIDPRARFLERERITRGALLGGAVGDALGAPIEFMKYDQIVAAYGAQGVTEFVSGHWPAGSITDDTQMTLFTAETMLRWESRAMDKGMSSHFGVGMWAYRRWLHTQGEPVHLFAGPNGWLMHRPELQHRRAPGNTCLEALRLESEEYYQYTNNSKGCGAVMRSAPVGLFKDVRPETCYEMAVDLARCTHFNPEGQVPAGLLALIMAQLRDGLTLNAACERALGVAVLHRKEAPLTFRLLERAIRMGTSGKTPSQKQVALLGEGWVAEEALAIAVYCALAAGEDFARGVRLAVNHDGDSDSTGAICGNILGAALGVDAIPAEWRARVECREIIEQLADDLVAVWRVGREWEERYPPN